MRTCSDRSSSITTWDNLNSSFNMFQSHDKAQISSASHKILCPWTNTCRCSRIGDPTTWSKDIQRLLDAVGPWCHPTVYPAEWWHHGSNLEECAVFDRFCLFRVPSEMEEMEHMHPKVHSINFNYWHHCKEIRYKADNHQTLSWQQKRHWNDWRLGQPSPCLQ